MTISLHGIGVARGYAIGNALILHRNQPEVAEYMVPPKGIKDEIKRFKKALKQARSELHDVRERIPHNVPADIRSFIDTHVLMLEDPTISEAPIELIRSHGCNSEWALKMQRDLVVQVFDEMDDPYLRTRRDDVDHVVLRLQRILLADESIAMDFPASRMEGRVIIADDLTPADTILMQHQGIAAFVTEYGGPLSHTAILARNLGIPAIVGMRNVRRYLDEEETVIVDGESGTLIAAPDDATLLFYRKRQQQYLRGKRSLAKLKSKPAITRDGHQITLHANIELPEDAAAARKVGSDGIGLYRTEFLFMNRDDLPDEEEHLASYMHVINRLGKNKPITIRTADLGADKQVDGGRIAGPMSTNPALGLRAVRLCLKELDLFKPQLRAILRASAVGNVKMMIPMISNTQEVQQVLRLIEESKQELADIGAAFDPNIPVGGMIEVPAAAICAEYFSRILDFLSIGTNDLIQYTLAIDRIDDEVNYLYDPLHPAVINLLHHTINAGRKAKIPVTLCGEMAGDPRYTKLLIGLGLTNFSAHPANLLDVKRVIKDSDAASLKAMVKKALRCVNPDHFSKIMNEIAGD